MAAKIFIFALMCIIIGKVSCGNVLVLLTQASQSHKNVFEPIIQGLADRNHKITVASPYQGKPRKNVREIVPNNFATTIKSKFGNPFELRSKGALGMISSFGFIFDTCHETYTNKEFRALENEKFDLIFIDAIMNDCLYGFIHKLAAPFIIVSPSAVPSAITESVGNRQPPSFVPMPMMPFSDRMSFVQRLSNVAGVLMFELVKELIFKNKINGIYRQHLGEDLPGFYEITQNASMIFSNSHFAINYPKPLLPDVVEVGGMHCRPAQALPKDLDAFISGAKDGLILFSLGSVVQAKDMPDEVRQKFLNVFSRLKQRVLWKWETGEMAGLPANVKVSKWLPQQDILGHPNTKLFITHGGLLSTLEATYHGVPLIGVPIFGDQDLNMAQAERAGYALTIEILTMTEEKLENAIHQILQEKYTEKVKYLSSIYRDQMNTPLERALYWSEYVMRHQGAPQLRSAARDLNFFQYYCLDVTAALIAIVVALIWALKLMIVGLFRCVFRTKATSLKKIN